MEDQRQFNALTAVSLIILGGMIRTSARLITNSLRLLRHIARGLRQIVPLVGGILRALWRGGWICVRAVFQLEAGLGEVMIGWVCREPKPRLHITIHRPRNEQVVGESFLIAGTALLPHGRTQVTLYLAVGRRVYELGTAALKDNTFELSALGMEILPEGVTHLATSSRAESLPVTLFAADGPLRSNRVRLHLSSQTDPIDAYQPTLAEWAREGSE